jgi:outer membrane protein TolC
MRRLAPYLAMTCVALGVPRAHAEPASAPNLAAVAQSQPVAVRTVYDLRRCLELAQQNYPKIHEAKARLGYKQGQLWQARTQPYSEFTVTGGVGPAPTVRGTNVYSPNTDVSLSSDMGVGWQVGIEAAIPLWTFGKLTNLWSAAEAQVVVGEHEVKRERNDVALAVRRAYYGLQLARDSLALVREARARVDKYVTRLAARVEEGDGDDVELLKLRINQAELEARESEAARQELLALSGLRFLTGVRGVFDIPNRPLSRVAHSLAPVGRYLEAARLFRPEINMARAGIAARRAQVELERSRYFPDLALALSAKWARAPQVVDQSNPFVTDNGNYLRYGAAVVLKWKLDFLPQSARLAQAQAQLEEIRATERYALGGVGVEVEHAYAEARDAARRLDAYSRATSYAKQWLVKVQQGIDVGTYEDEDIVDPAREYATKRFLQMSAMLDYNVAVAKLAQTSGWDAIGPRE